MAFETKTSFAAIHTEASCLASHTLLWLGCTFRGTKSDVDAHKSCCSCSSELHIQTVTMTEVRVGAGDMITS